jgi:D-alanine-D-alanine ligase
VPADPAGAGRPALRLRDRVAAGDVGAVECLVRATGAFSAEEVAIAAELVEARLRQGPASGYEFLFADGEGELLGYTCYGPIGGTRASYDLYWIAVAPDLQGCGLGSRLLSDTEARIAVAGGRRVYVDTAGRPDYERTRRFYARAGYVLEATLPDFYAPGDAKLIYRKVLEPVRDALPPGW